MKLFIALIVAFALVVATVATEDSLAVLASRMEAERGPANCNVYTCVGSTVSCVTETACAAGGVGCNICQGNLGCFQGEGTADNTCQNTFIGLPCDDDNDCLGFPLARGAFCGTDHVCRWSSSQDLETNDYCCDDCECASETCISGRCNPIAAGGDCTNFNTDDCLPSQYCNGTTDLCTARPVDGASCAGVCLFGSACHGSPSVCVQACSLTPGAACTPGFPSTCPEGYLCNGTNCVIISTTGLGNACNATTPCTNFGQVCQCNHATGAQTCVATPTCCAEGTALISCMRTNACADSSDVNDPRSCARAHCSSQWAALNSCGGTGGIPAACVSTSFAESTLGPNRDCGSAAALTSWLSLFGF